MLVIIYNDAAAAASLPGATNVNCASDDFFDMVVAEGKIAQNMRCFLDEWEQR